MTHILAIGLNPALQRTLVFDSIERGAVNRASREVISPGGKAVHFARAANTFFPGVATPAFFSGGIAGERICTQLAAMGIACIVVDVPAETRTCTTLIETTSTTATELVGPAQAVSPEAVGRMEQVLVDHVHNADALAFCGTYPDGVDETLFLRLMERHGDKPVLVDAYKGMNQVLATGRVTILKITLEEARELTGQETVSEVADYCLDRFGLAYLMLTDGAGAAYLLTADEQLKFDVNCIEIVNPIGAGDTCAGVMFAAYLNGVPAEQAFRKGLAAAMASCQHYEGACVTPATMEAMMAEITVSRIERG